MKFKYLGTAAAEGWPAPFCRCSKCEEARKRKGKNYRTRPQALINEDLLMDLGPDTYYHALQYDLHLDNVSTVLLTHSHSDHFYPLELILRAEPYAYGQNRRPLVLYGNEKCHGMYQALLTHDEVPARFESYVQFREIRPFEPFTVDCYRILPLKAIHDPRETCLIYAICTPDNKWILYGNDTGSICPETWNAIKEITFDLVSLDCTMGTNPACASHLSLEADASIRIRMLEEGLASEKTVFAITHFSHGCCPLHEELSQIAGASGFVTAYDGMELEI